MIAIIVRLVLFMAARQRMMKSPLLHPRIGGMLRILSSQAWLMSACCRRASFRARLCFELLRFLHVL